MPFCVQSKGKYLLFIDRVLYSVTGGQLCPGRQDSSRVTGGQTFMEDRAGLCWRTWSLGERTLLEYAERYTSPYLCKSDGYVRVHAVCNWQSGLTLGDVCAKRKNKLDIYVYFMCS